MDPVTFIAQVIADCVDLVIAILLESILVIAIFLTGFLFGAAFGQSGKRAYRDLRKRDYQGAKRWGLVVVGVIVLYAIIRVVIFG